MKIGILTYYGVHSHGAVLQANALKSVLEGKGHSVEFLTFERNYDFIPQELSKKYKIDIKSIPFYGRYLIQKGPSNILRNIQKNNTLNHYRKSHFTMGPRYSDFDGDMVVVGSDEVFSLEIGINPFMYGHGMKSIPVISYAGCFGPTTVEDIIKKGEVELITSGLLKMKAISVRDENSQKIIKSLLGKEVQIVTDPVFLYGYEKEILNNVVENNGYILVYSYDKNMNDKDEVRYIKEYASRKGMTIVAVGYPHKWCDKYVDADPDELIGYIKSASYVITDTFHGTVLSLLCNTDFVVKLRDNKNKLGYLLHEYMLDNRAIESFDQLQHITDQKINYDVINSLIAEKRKNSMAYLDSSLI